MTPRVQHTYRSEVALAVKVTDDSKPSVRKVVLVDDHEMYLKYCSRDFVRAGVSVSSANSLRGAVDMVRQERPDVAVVDLFLSPPESGLEVIRAIKKVDSSVFCILVSAHMSVSHALMGVRAGADDVFIKPFGARQVIARVERGALDEPDPTTPTLHEVEWEHISRVLHDHAGNVSQAAESLGIFRQSLQRKIQKYAPRVLATEDAKPYPIVIKAEEEPPPPPPAKPKSKPRAKKSKKSPRH